MTNPEYINIIVPPVCGVPADYLVGLSGQFTQSGGTFTATFVNEPGVPSFASKTFASAFGNYVAIIDDVTTGKGSSGNLIRVDGKLIPPALLHTRPVTYFNTLPWLVPAGGNSDHLNDFSAYLRDPTVELIYDLKFSLLMANLAAEHGLSIQYLGPFIDYRIYKYVLDGSKTLYEAIQGLCGPAGLNAVINGQVIQLIPWDGYVSTQSVVISLDEVIGDFSYTTAISEFDGLVVHSSSEMTPYNSCYAGLPERIASLSFEAGPVSIKDLSFGTGIVQPSKQWFFPKDLVLDDKNAAKLERAKSAVGQNAWLKMAIAYSTTKNTADYPITSFIASTAGVNTAWDYDYIENTAINYQDLYADLAANSNLPLNGDITNLLPYYTYSETRYQILVRWNHARTLIENPGDVHPFIYVLPSDKAPDDLKFGGFKLPDNQELTLLGYGQSAQERATSGQMDPSLADTYFSGIPLDLKGITPEGFGFKANIHHDGSFFADAYFTPQRAKRKYLEDPILAVKINPTDSFYTDFCGSAIFRKGQDKIEVEYVGYADAPDKPPEATLAAHLRTLQSRTGSIAVVPKQIGVRLPNKIPSTINDNQYIEDSNAMLALDAEDKFLVNCYHIRQIVDVTDPGNDDEINPDKAIILINQASAIDSTGDYSFSRGRLSLAEPLVNQVSSTGTIKSFVDSGLVEENTQSISASWSLYGIRRKTFPAMCVVSQLGFYTYYTGVNEYQAQIIQQALQGRSGQNTKHVESELITDFMGSNSHLEQLSKLIYRNMLRPYNRYSVSYIGRDFNPPPIGCSVTVDNVPSQIVSTSFNFTRGSGLVWTIEAGALPIL